jgi:hypothetical protein
MAKYKPIGNIEWNSVADCFNSKMSDNRPERDVGSICRKFTFFYTRKQSTRDPNIPEAVLRAKEIEAEIKKKSQMVDTENMTDGSDEEEVNDEENRSIVVSGKNTGSNHETPAVNKKVNAGSGGSGGSSKSGKRERPKNSTKAAAETSKILEAFIRTEKMGAKREERREKRLDKRDKRNMKMFMGMMATAVNLYARHKAASNEDVFDVQTLTKMVDSSNDSSESSLSQYDSDDTPPTKRLKFKRMEEKKRKRRRKNDYHIMLLLPTK